MIRPCCFQKLDFQKNAGYFFDHGYVINHLHKLIGELKAIENYYKGISNYQDVMNEYWNDYLTEFEYYGHEY
jgi:hypothetical protein